jgi:subtilisin
MGYQPTLQKFVLLPSRGLRASHPEQRSFLTHLYKQEVQEDEDFSYSASGSFPVDMHVLDQIHEDGAKLVEMSLQSARNLRIHQPGIRVVPLVTFAPAVVDLPTPVSKPQSAGFMVSLKTTIQVISGKDGSPIEGAKVIWFSDFANGVGDEGTTNSQGKVSFSDKAIKTVEQLYIYPPYGFWGLRRQNIVLSTGSQFELVPIDLTYRDGLRYFYENISDDAGHGVKVGVIDTGIANHPDLHISGGENLTGEDPGDYGDNGIGHGTHVAGIIAARGVPPNGIRGMAPAAELFSYRVFGQGQSGASNYAIAKAIDHAVANGCHLINMSLGGGPPDPVTEAAIEDAYSSGTLIFVAVGNDGRQDVNFPASYSSCIAVSAIGRIGTFPVDTVEEAYNAPPFGNDPNNFIASFSNFGPQMDLTGPGVGIISTFPGGYAVLDGTSMATPAATGVAARILAQAENILNMPPDHDRADAMIKVILEKAQRLGFGPEFEGFGILVV